MHREIQIKQFPIVTTHWWPRTRNERFVWENEQYLYSFLPLVHNHVQVIWVRTCIRCVCALAMSDVYAREITSGAFRHLRRLTPHSHGASLSTPLVDFEWSDVKRCRTELWVRRVTSLALLAAEVENFSSANGGVSQSDRLMQISNPVHATPEKYVIGCCNYDGASAPRFRHALRQALTPMPRVNAAWARARAHTRHTPDACAHSFHLDMVVYKR